MTVVVGVCTYTDAFLVADSRLTWPNSLRRDMCQKLFVVNDWCVLGIAGNLCLLRYLAGPLIELLRSIEYDQQEWLRNDEASARFIFEGVVAHGNPALNPGHERCTQESTEFLIFWRDYARWSPTDESFTGPPIPDPRLIAIRYRDGKVQIRRERRGALVIGRVPEFGGELHDDDFDNLVTYFGRYDGKPEVRDAQRALLATTEIRKRLIERGRTKGVGGLHQVMTVGSNYIQTVPYFYLADVEPGYKTYVAMRIENGEWVQEHRPTGINIRIRSPWDIDVSNPPRFDSVFEPSERFTKDSPGVIPAQQWGTVFSLYNPPNVPEAVRPSWGDAPIRPLTYGPKWWNGPDQPSWATNTETKHPSVSDNTAG